MLEGLLAAGQLLLALPHCLLPHVEVGVEVALSHCLMWRWVRSGVGGTVALAYAEVGVEG